MKNLKATQGLALGAALFSTAALADGTAQVEPVELLIDFKIQGAFSGIIDTDNDMIPDSIVYTIAGPGYAPLGIGRSGEIPDPVAGNRIAAFLDGAEVVFPIFDFQNPENIPDIVEFTCLPGSCNIHLLGGSVVTSDAGVPLSGRAPFFWGPVVNSPDFDPLGVFPTRILGCGGLEEVAQTGPYSGMIGSICFNGVLNFDFSNPFSLDGGSKCTITLHTPAEPEPNP